MSIAKIEDGVVVQIDHTTNTLSPGWVLCDFSTVCGMLYANGVFTNPPTPPPPVPQAVEPRKFRRALRIANLHADAMAYIATLSPEEQDDFEYAVEIRIDNPTVLGAVAALNKTQADLEALFVLASQQP